MTDVTVETVEITDLGAQARGNRVFGIKIGEDTHLSFETTPGDYDPAVTFCLIGVMEGLRYRMHDAVLVLPNGRTLHAPHEDEGVTLVGDGIESYFPDWGSALDRIRSDEVDSTRLTPGPV